jgi:hypothetical protein
MCEHMCAYHKHLSNIPEQGLGPRVFAGKHDTYQGLGLVKAGLDSIYVSLWGPPLPGGAKEGAGWIF